jgi:hypothetical protein
MVRWFASVLLCLAAMAWAPERATAGSGKQACDPDPGITLPAGFCATVFADHLGVARHMVVSGSGDLYVALESRAHGGGIVVLRDTDGDGKADLERWFGDDGGTGIGLHAGYLFRHRHRGAALRAEAGPGPAGRGARTGGERLPDTVRALSQEHRL